MTTLYKTVAESRTYEADYSIDWPELLGSNPDLITGGEVVAISGDDELDIGDAYASQDGTKLMCPITGGTIGVSYQLLWNATTTLGSVLPIPGVMNVVAFPPA